MAQTVTQLSQADFKKSNIFNKTFELNIDLGAKCMRELATKYLQQKGVTLQTHLSEPKVRRLLQRGHLFPDQKAILNSSDPFLKDMDITLLALLLLNTFPGIITRDMEENLTSLREIRTQLAHSTRTELEDYSMFNETSQLILAISKVISRTYYEEMAKLINELRRREQVRPCMNMDIIRVNGEDLMFMVVKESSGEGPIDRPSELMIKFGLTKWVKQLSRGIDVSSFLQQLRQGAVIREEDKRAIEQKYSYDEQIQELILHMVKRGSTEEVFKFCRLLRKMSPQLADLVEGTNTDGMDIEQYLSEKEEMVVTRFLDEEVVEIANESITTEDMHIRVEEHTRMKFEFSVLRQLIRKRYTNLRFTDQDGSFHGLAWKTEPSGREPTDQSEEDFQNLSCEDFAEYMGMRFSKIKANLATSFKTAILEESISPTSFAQMTKEEMETTFTEYLEDTKYGFGIRKELLEIQKLVRDSACTVNILDDSDIEQLRHFDACMPSGKNCYRLAQVRAKAGNLLVPQHEFVFPQQNNNTHHFVVKEVVRFTAACINGRKNGTIHLGIKPLAGGFGKIIGLSRNCLNLLNEEIDTAIIACFQINAAVAFACMGPLHIIPVEESQKVVVELDVIPFSKYLTKQMVPIFFPPKGSQRREFFIYDIKQRIEILPVSAEKVKDVEDVFEKVLKQRDYLENELYSNENNADEKLQSKLTRLLTGGNRYVKDEFVPVIVLGNLSGNPYEEDVRNTLEIDKAFISAKDVLDFDSSVGLRKSVEKEKSYFKVVTAEDLQDGSEREKQSSLPSWIYCNGNSELGLSAQPLSEWIRERNIGLKHALNQIRDEIPKERCVLIFLIFDSPKHLQEPVFEVARDALSSTFRNECVVISDKEENVSYLRKEVSRLVDDTELERCFVTGLDWSTISRVLNTVFEESADVIYKLPCSKGHFVEMTLKEKEGLELSDIEIIGGEQCQHEESLMNDEERKCHKTKSQETFYKGGTVSWWNFYYEMQVGKRSQFIMHVKEMKEKLEGNTVKYVEIQEIEHHPGAGGSTLGRHLLWEFSQFKHQPSRAYRCCIVDRITEDTVNQINRFREFKDGEDTKPFIVLIDNESEEDVIVFRNQLTELAYKSSTPGELFCLLLIISRKPITYEKARGRYLLMHELTKEEKNWFETKYNEMEKQEIDVDTLIAFNCMRMAFSPAYIKRITKNMLAGVTSKEMEVLKCLALINSYESDEPVPQNIFDKMMDENYDLSLLTRQPYGIKHHIKELNRQAKMQTSRKTWNVDMTDAMKLLLTKRNHGDLHHSGVCIISQLLAQSILKFILESESICLEKIVDIVLNLVEHHKREENPMSKKFVNIVSSLFKTRQLMDTEKGDMKFKFSDLVLELERRTENNEDDASRHDRVLRVMQRCFNITEDAMVGQQLARFNIHIGAFEAAVAAIEKSLSIRPQNSYLFDTYGQIFRAKMVHQIDSCYQKDCKIQDTDAAEIIELAWEAIHKFRDGQELTKKYDDDTNWSCFNMEVKTYLHLLDRFTKFACYEDRENFLAFLNNQNFVVESSSFADLITLCPSLEDIRNGREPQIHVQDSLRSLEERFYQLKKRLFVVHTDNEVLLLKLREQLERFYGSPGRTSHYKFLYGVGLKPLESAKANNLEMFNKRFKEAEQNLLSSLARADERDLLVYLGAKILQLSNLGQTSESCSNVEYKTMLQYSTKLVDLQTASHSRKRLYLETFLYHAMLHWPLKSRTEPNFEELSGPVTYLEKLERWEKTFNDNFYLTSFDRRRKNKPKNFFALAQGKPGSDIIDLDSIKKEWERRKKRKHVLRDHFWREPFVRAKLLRLEGTVDGSGHFIKHKVEYPQHGSRDIRINTYYPCDKFSNRVVTFVLGFTWKGPTAFDVDEKGREDEVPDDRSDDEHKADEVDDWNDQELHRTPTRSVRQETAIGAKAKANEDAKPARSKQFSKNSVSVKRTGILDSENTHNEVPDDKSDDEHKEDRDDDWNDQKLHRFPIKSIRRDTAIGAKAIENEDAKPARSKQYSKNSVSIKRTDEVPDDRSDNEHKEDENPGYGDRHTAVVTSGMSDIRPFAEYSALVPSRSTAGDSSLQFKSSKCTTTSSCLDTSNKSDNSDPSPVPAEKSKLEGQEIYTANDRLTQSLSPETSDECTEQCEVDEERTKDTRNTSPATERTELCEVDEERTKDTINTSPATEELASGLTGATPDDSDVHGQTKKKGGQQKPVWKSQLKKRKHRKK